MILFGQNSVETIFISKFLINCLCIHILSVNSLKEFQIYNL